MKLQIVSIAAIGMVAVAAAILAPKTLYINGQKSTKTVIVQNGETYIPASALSASGADVAITDSRVSVQFKPVKTQNEQAYVEGVMGEWVTSGPWRFKITNVAAITNPINGNGGGFALDFEAKNASDKTIQMAYSGVAGLQVIDEADNRYAPTSTSFKDYYADIQPGGGFKNRIEFGSDGAPEGKPPSKLIIQFAKPLKSIRIDLKP